MSRWLYQLSYGPVSAIAVGWFYRPIAALSSDRPRARGDHLRARGSGLDEVFELAAASRVAQLAQSLGLDLTDALPGHGEVLPDLL